MILSNMANVPLIVNKHKGYEDTEIFNGIQEAIFKNGKTKK